MNSPTPEGALNDTSKSAAARPFPTARVPARSGLLPASCAALGVLAGCGGVNPGPPEDDRLPPAVEWRIAFEDNFDGGALDTSKWNIQTGDGCPDLCGWGNNELQVYGAGNIAVADGMLNIIGRREADGRYTSARINTKGKFDFRYGRVEVRARIPSGQGIWPAIWMLHSNPEIYGPWPTGGEIDIMEAFNYGVGGNATTSAATHYGLPYPAFHGGTSSRTALAVGADVNFHVYALEWERDQLRFFVDDTHFQTQNAHNWYTYYPAGEDGLYDPFGPFTLGPDGEPGPDGAAGPDGAPFDQPFHLLLNFAIGGNTVGRPDATTVLPQTFAVDYVRVYECANGNAETGEGCGTADRSVVPLEDFDGGPLEDVETAKPFISDLRLYTDGPEAITLNVGEDEATNTLGVDGFTGAGAAVVNDPAAADPDDGGNTVWHFSVAGDVANAYLTSEDLGAHEILDTGFDFSSGDSVGEIVFDMRVNSIDPGAALLVKLDSGWPNLGQVALPMSRLRVGGWKTYSVKFADLVANPGFVDCCGGMGVDLANVVNPFVIEAAGGAVDLHLDNIRISNACYIVGSCKAGLRTKRLPDLVVFNDEVNTRIWNNGIRGSDSGSGFTDYTDPAGAGNKVHWAVIDDEDPERGKVIDVTFNDSGAFGVWFIQSSRGVDMNEYAAGAVAFDIIVDDYGRNDTGITMKVDCMFPCTSGDKNLGAIADGAWETVMVPVSSLTGSGLDLNEVNTGIVVFPTAPQDGTIRFRLDNIRWVAETDAPELAQIDLPVTFDDPATDYTLVDFGGAATEVAEDPEDASNSVAGTRKPAGAETWAGTIVGTDAGFANPVPFTSGAAALSLDVHSPAAGIPIMLKVEDGQDPGIFAEVVAFPSFANQWETLTYDFMGMVDPVNFTYEKAIVFFDFGNPGADGRLYLWDNLRFGGGEAPMLRRPGLPITFDDPGVDYNYVDFGGAETSLVADPDNMSNTVASTIKHPDQTWAGTVVADAGMESPVPFAAGSTVMSVRVRSPDAGIPVRLKVENTANGAVSVETEATTTVADAWETLRFDFGSHAAGTPALDLAQTYDKVVIFFDFGTVGADKTYLWDDIRFIGGVAEPAGPAPARPELPITFDDPDLDYAIRDFGGTVTTLAADPGDAANTVASTLKPPGETWAGTVVADTGMASPVPFADGSTAISVRVRSPDAGIPVRLKVENTANGAISVETETMTAAAGEWEVLNFDFSNHVDGTAALDLSRSYDKVVIFFDFGAAGADKTYLWDDIRFASAASGE